MSRTIRIAVVQMFAQPAPVSERLKRAETLVTQAAGQGAQLVVLPEVFNTGYEYSDQNYARAERPDGPTVTWMKKTAARNNVHLAGSLLLLDYEDIYNAMLLIAPDGRTWRYDKLYPPLWERAYFCAGHHLTIAQTDLGRLGLMICWDVVQPELWARYAGKVDAIIACSCPPTLHRLTLVFPDGKRVEMPDLGPIHRRIALTSDHLFDLRRYAAYLRVPVANTTGAGLFSSTMPLPHLSLMLFIPTRPDLWKYLAQAAATRIEAGYFNETCITNAQGHVLARVPPHTEGYALAEVTLADSPPQPQGSLPPSPASAFLYRFDDFANLVLPVVYRQNVRRIHGQHMAPITRPTRLWLTAAALAGMAGYLLGRTISRKR